MVDLSTTPVLPPTRHRPTHDTLPLLWGRGRVPLLTSDPSSRPGSPRYAWDWRPAEGLPREVDFGCAESEAVH